MIGIGLVLVLIIMNPKIMDFVQGDKMRDKDAFTISKEIETPHSSLIQYNKLDKGIIKYLDGILFYYNTEGQQQWGINLGISNPLFKTSKNFAYAVEGNRRRLIKVDKDGEIMYNRILEKPLFNLEVGEEDYVIIQHLSEGNLEYVTIIDEIGNKAGEVTISEGKILNTAISEKHDRVAISTIDVNAEGIESTVLIYDLQGNLKELEKFPDEIILSLFYGIEGQLIVVQEDRVLGIEEKKARQWSQDINNMKIIEAESGGRIVFYEKQEKGGLIHTGARDRIRFLSYDGKWMGEAVLKETINGINLSENQVVLHSPRSIYLMDTQGESVKEYSYGSDINQAFLLSSNRIAVITKEKISFIELVER